MTTLFIALKLLWKRKLINFILVLQILLSIIMLAQLFVFVTDHLDNMRAVNELPIKNAIVLSVFDYYNEEYVIQEIQSSLQVDSVGRVYMGNLSCNNVSCNLAVYNEGIIAHYLPQLQSGSWLSDSLSVIEGAVPTVISADIGLKVGDTVDVSLSKGKTTRIIVIGILEEPTQYLFPSGGASSVIFSAKAIIAQSPVVIMRDTDFGDTSILLPPPEMPIPQSLFVFLKADTAKDDVDAILDPWRKYGEVTPMESLISTYNKNTSTMIGAGIIFFVVFFFLAATSVLSNNVIQSLRNRRQFTVYYLLGMNWKKGAAIEICRVVILIIITIALSLLAGKYGLLMLEWMTQKRAYLFYGVVFLYIVVMFFAVGAGFLIKLMREDISGALKDLQQGE